MPTTRITVEVDVLCPQRGDLPAATAGVHEQPDQGGVAAVHELPAVAGSEHGPELVIGEHRNRLLRHSRHAPAVHRGALDLLSRISQPKNCWSARKTTEHVAGFHCSVIAAMNAVICARVTSVGASGPPLSAHQEASLSTVPE